jgi:hypothetical protein
MASSASSKPEIKVTFMETTAFDNIVPRKARSDENGNCLVTAASMDRIHDLLREVNDEMYSIQKITYNMLKTPKEKIPIMDILSLAKKTSDAYEKSGKAMDFLYISAFFPHIKKDPSASEGATPCGEHLKLYSNPSDLAALLPVYVPVSVPVPTEEEDLYS